MRPRVERVLLCAILAVGGGWALRAPLRPARWALQGAWELMRLPALPAAPSLSPPPHVAHAGGALRGLRYTNALEALAQNYALGARWFEMDFLADAQGAFWAVHDWEEAPGRLHPATLEQVLDWFAAHGDARLITDTKGDNGALLRRLEAEPAQRRSRIHPQIYRIAEYAQARAGGFAAPIFTTYRSNYPWWVLRRFVRQSALLAVTVTRSEASDACAALCGQVPLLTHTVNDPSDAQALMKAGIAGIYTDDLLP